MKVGRISREIEYYLHKEKTNLRVKLEYRGNLIDKIKIDKEKKRARKKNISGGGATRNVIDFLA